MPYLTNKEARREFLKGYRNWTLVQSIPTLELKIYEFKFANGSKIIATEYKSKYTENSLVNYCLLLPDSDTFDDWHRAYNPNGDSVRTLHDYMLRNRDGI